MPEMSTASSATEPGKHETAYFMVEADGVVGVVAVGEVAMLIVVDARALSVDDMLVSSRRERRSYGTCRGSRAPGLALVVVQELTR